MPTDTRNDLRLGVTGTRDGLTVEQHRAMVAWMRANPAAELHFGCCIGADEEAWEAATCVYGDACTTVAHVPDSPRFVSTSALSLADEASEPLPYLERNRAIVAACEVLLALPKGPEELRAGTWATVRAARKAGRRIVICWPDGTTTEEPARG